MGLKVDYEVKRRSLAILLCCVAALATVTVCAPTPAIAAAPNTANLWVDLNGGTCARQGTASPYADASACSTIDAAWDACQPGDTIVIKSGTYGGQTITGNKVSPGCTVIGEAGTTIGALATNGTFFTLQDVTVDVGNAHKVGWDTAASNITLRNVNFHGPFVSIGIGDDNITWQGGEFGVAGQVGGQRNFCGTDEEPITIFGANNVTFDNIRFHPQATNADPGCNHMEYIRIDSGGSNFTMRNSMFDNGDASNTSTIFVTNPTGGATYSGLKLENNVFGTTAAGAVIKSQDPNMTGCTNWTIAYNTFLDVAYSSTCTNHTGTTWIGNTGAYPSFAPCHGTHTKNVWQHNLAGTCGSDIWVIGPAFRADALGLGGVDGFHLQVGSRAINAAETAGYCTSTLRRDKDGEARPMGTACDAGADEFTDTFAGPAAPTGLAATVR